jgi:hypothetical protein
MYLGGVIWHLYEMDLHWEKNLGGRGAHSAPRAHPYASARDWIDGPRGPCGLPPLPCTAMRGSTGSAAARLTDEWRRTKDKMDMCRRCSMI